MVCREEREKLGLAQVGNTELQKESKNLGSEGCAQCTCVCVRVPVQTHPCAVLAGWGRQLGIASLETGSVQ